MTRIDFLIPSGDCFFCHFKKLFITYYLSLAVKIIFDSIPAVGGRSRRISNYPLFSSNAYPVPDISS